LESACGVIPEGFVIVEGVVDLRPHGYSLLQRQGGIILLPITPSNLGGRRAGHHHDIYRPTDCPEAEVNGPVLIQIKGDLPGRASYESIIVIEDDGTRKRLKGDETKEGWELIFHLGIHWD
jgi:hypothetical protein